MKLQRNKTLSAITLTVMTDYCIHEQFCHSLTPIPLHGMFLPTATPFATVNPVGAGQPTGITFWLNAVPPTAFGAYGDRWTFTIEITKPDGSKDNIGPITSDPVVEDIHIQAYTGGYIHCSGQIPKHQSNWHTHTPGRCLLHRWRLHQRHFPGQPKQPCDTYGNRQIQLSNGLMLLFRQCSGLDR